MSFSKRVKKSIPLETPDELRKRVVQAASYTEAGNILAYVELIRFCRVNSDDNSLRETRKIILELNCTLTKVEEKFEYAQACHYCKFYNRAYYAFLEMAKGGWWRAQFRLGFLLERDGNYKSFSDDGGLELLKQSAGPHHWEGLAFYYAYLSMRKKGVKKIYYMMRVLALFPWVIGRMEDLGGPIKEDKTEL